MQPKRKKWIILKSKYEAIVLFSLNRKVEQWTQKHITMRKSVIFAHCFAQMFVVPVDVPLVRMPNENKKKKMCRKYIVSGNNKSTSLIIWIKYSFFARNFALQLNHLLLASKVMKRLPQIYTVRFALYFNALTKMKVQTKLINTINIYACKTMFMESEKSLVKWVQLIGMGLKSMSKSILEIFFSPFLTH